MTEKKYQTHTQRIEILKRRNMNIRGNASKEKRIIEENNYYNLINGYKHLFLNKLEMGKDSHDGSDIFISGTKPSELHAVYKFDNELRNIFLKELLTIENKVKHAIVQAFYEEHNHEELHKHMEFKKSTYYDVTPITFVQKTFKDKVYTTTEVLTDNTVSIPSNVARTKEFNVDRLDIHSNFGSNIISTIEKQKDKKDSIKYYMSEHEYVPYWVLTNILTMGSISYLFIILKKETAFRVLDNLGITHENKLIDIYNFYKVLGILTLYRNICAHNERFFCDKHAYTIDDYFMNFGKSLPFYRDPKSSVTLKGYQKMKRTESISGVYSLIFSISIFYENDRRLKLFKRIDSSLEKLSKKLKTIDIKKVKEDMSINFDLKAAIETIESNKLNM